MGPRYGTGAGDDVAVAPVAIVAAVATVAPDENVIVFFLVAYLA